VIDTHRLAELAQEHGVPGAALAVLASDEVHEVAVGVTNKSTGVDVTTDTLFQIGSVTKVWTTTLVQILADEGLLSLDAPVHSYVPELKLVDEDVAARLTVKHLLNHSSGLPGDFFPDTGRGDDCLERYLPVLAEVELTHPLGALFSYSNAAFVLTGLVIERVTGGTWDQALRTRLIQPLGLPKTVTLPEEALLHRAAVGHIGIGDDQRVAPVWVLPRNCGPAGLICAQVRDVVEFARLHLTGGLSRAGDRLVSADAIEAMQQVTISVPGADAARLGFGLGWGLGRWSDSPVLLHDGGTIGQACALRVLPEKNVAICLAANGGDWMQFRDAVLAEITPEVAGVTPPKAPTPTDTPPTIDPTPYVGVYRNIGSKFTVATDESGAVTIAQQVLDPLEALADNDKPAETRTLQPQAEDSFLLAMPGEKSWIPVLFVRGADGAVEYLHAGGRAARKISG
jgi:CubicO group peptidase (beta-lactamase class C family)